MRMKILPAIVVLARTLISAHIAAIKKPLVIRIMVKAASSFAVRTCVLLTGLASRNSAVWLCSSLATIPVPRFMAWMDVANIM